MDDIRSGRYLRKVPVAGCLMYIPEIGFSTPCWGRSAGPGCPVWCLKTMVSLGPGHTSPRRSFFSPQVFVDGCMPSPVHRG